jgi:bacterioferritin
MAQHYELENKDFGKLASKLKETAIVEMKHAEKLADRILFLDGEPTSKPDGLAKKGQEITEMLKTDIGLESESMRIVNEAALSCAAEKDQISKEIFEELLKDDEGHLDKFENIKDHVDRLGTSYLAALAG